MRVFLFWMILLFKISLSCAQDDSGSGEREVETEDLSDNTWVSGAIGAACVIAAVLLCLFIGSVLPSSRRTGTSGESCNDECWGCNPCPHKNCRGVDSLA